MEKGDPRGCSFSLAVDFPFHLSVLSTASSIRTSLPPRRTKRTQSAAPGHLVRRHDLSLTDVKNSAFGLGDKATLPFLHLTYLAVLFLLEIRRAPKSDGLCVA